MINTASYPKDTAGSLITNNIPIFDENTTIEAAVKVILTKTKEYKTINYVYVVDARKNLRGVISIKNLLDASEQKLDLPLHNFIRGQSLITVHPYSHQEKAAQLAVKYGVKAIPVVDKEGKFLGIIDSDHILSIMHEEKVEDLLKFAGLPKSYGNLDDFLSIPLFLSLKHRIPWLILGLGGGLLISQVIALFEETLRDTVIIASFIPMMVYMSNAVGQQVTALFIRDSALNENIPYAKYFFKQFLSVLIIGFILSGLLFVASYFLHYDLGISYALSLAMFGTVASSILAGFVIPLIFIKFKQDPANSSGPIGTVIQDFLSVLIYFLIVSWFL